VDVILEEAQATLAALVVMGGAQGDARVLRD
jgi:hypothetical protein